MANAVRGESELLAGGKSLLMRLTLGALADIEDGLGLGNIADIADRLKSLATKDIAVVAAALLRGGGIDISPAEVMTLETDVGSLVGAITGAFDASGIAKPATAPAPKAAPSPLAGTPSSNSGSA
jgi:hypothetical protein